MFLKTVFLFYIFFIIIQASRAVADTSGVPPEELSSDDDDESVKKTLEKIREELLQKTSDFQREYLRQRTLERIEKALSSGDNDDSVKKTLEKIKEKLLQKKSDFQREYLLEKIENYLDTPRKRKINIDVNESQEIFRRDVDPSDLVVAKKKTFFHMKEEEKKTTPTTPSTPSTPPHQQTKRRKFSVPPEEMRLTEHVYKIKNFDHSEEKEFDTFVFITKFGKSSSPDEEGEENSLSNDIAPPSCCDYIADGARWYEQFSYKLDTGNNLGISTTYVNSVTNQSIEHIEDSTPEFRIHGEVIETSLPEFIDPNVPDGMNTIVFGTIDLDGVLGVAVTHIQGSTTPEIFEVDIIINEEFDIGDAEQDFNKYDFNSILIHELGHGVGLGHVPTRSECSGSTMWPSIGRGETSKRTLTNDDQTCVRALYDDEQIILPGSGALSLSPMFAPMIFGFCPFVL